MFLLSDSNSVLIVFVVMWGIGVCLAGLATGQRVAPPELQKSSLQRGAVLEGMEEVWKRVPNLRQRMVAEYAARSTPLFSFTGTPVALFHRSLDLHQCTLGIMHTCPTPV